MGDRESIKIEVRIFLPWARDVTQMNYSISAIEARETLIPLPRNREIDYRDMARAIEQKSKRERIAKFTANAITDAILTACEREDTVNGYKKERSP